MHFELKTSLIRSCAIVGILIGSAFSSYTAIGMGDDESDNRRFSLFCILRGHLKADDFENVNMGEEEKKGVYLSGLEEPSKDDHLTHEAWIAVEIGLSASSKISLPMVRILCQTLKLTGRSSPEEASQGYGRWLQEQLEITPPGTEKQKFSEKVPEIVSRLKETYVPLKYPQFVDAYNMYLRTL